jgi:hypothetical protein
MEKTNIFKRLTIINSIIFIAFMPVSSAYSVIKKPTSKTVIIKKPIVKKVITKPLPKPSSLPITGPISAVSPISIPDTSSIQILPNSWPLDKTAPKNIMSIADQSVRKFIDAAENKDTQFTLLVGPTTNKERAKEYTELLNKSINFWNIYWKPSQEVIVAIAEVQDYKWISSIWPKYGLSGGGFDSSELSWSARGVYCNQGGAISSIQPFFWGCMPSYGTFNHIGLKKFIPHEYTHIVQQKIMEGNTGLPIIITEGSADFYGMSLAIDSSMIENSWDTYFKTGFISTEAKNYLKNASVSDIEILVLKSLNGDNVLVNSHWYYTGAYITARLVAAKGNDTFINFVKDFKMSKDINKSLESFYQINIQDFAKLVAPEIKLKSNQLIFD